MDVHEIGVTVNKGMCENENSVFSNFIYTCFTTNYYALKKCVSAIKSLTGDWGTGVVRKVLIIITTPGRDK